MQVAASQFAAEPLGHNFALRSPLAKVTCKKCRECGADVYLHAASEVADRDLQVILDLVADSKATLIQERLLVGGFKAAIAECQADPATVVLNCAGAQLHAFLPNTKAPFDALRQASRVHDLEWEDSDAFVIDVPTLIVALQWARAQVESGKRLVINCAQGKSRSGTAATAYLVATEGLSAAAALARVQAARPFVQPNPGFLRQLSQMEPALLALREAFGK